MTESYIDTETKDVEIKSELIPLVPDADAGRTVNADGVVMNGPDDDIVYVQLLDEAVADPQDAKVD